MGLEGIVSKHRDRTYKAGRSTDWIKVKNPGLPATIRAKDEEFAWARCGLWASAAC
jgi:bifunctional non-homologous end joining protein LigD